MSVWDRIKEYPNQHFCNKNGKLRCNACSEMISSKKSSIERHIKFKKHKKGIAYIAKSKAESQTIMECLKRRDQRDCASSSTLPEEMQLFRFEIVESALSGGIALAKLDKLRPVLQRHGHRLTSCPHMHQIIPAVLEKEKSKLKEELNDIKQASFIFDSTARLGEALVIIIRYIQENFVQVEVCARLAQLVRSLTANQEVPGSSPGLVEG